MDLNLRLSEDGIFPTFSNRELVTDGIKSSRDYPKNSNFSAVSKEDMKFENIMRNILSGIGFFSRPDIIPNPSDDTVKNGKVSGLVHAKSDISISINSSSVAKNKETENQTHKEFDDVKQELNFRPKMQDKRKKKGKSEDAKSLAIVESSKKILSEVKVDSSKSKKSTSAKKNKTNAKVKK